MNNENTASFEQVIMMIEGIHKVKMKIINLENRADKTLVNIFLLFVITIFSAIVVIALLNFGNVAYWLLPVPMAFCLLAVSQILYWHSIKTNIERDKKFLNDDLKEIRDNYLDDRSREIFDTMFRYNEK